MLALTVTLGLPQQEQEPVDVSIQSNARLPNGKLQREEILKAEYKKATEESGRLLKLAEELNAELEKNPSSVLSIGTLKKTEEIEKLARKIRSRLRRY
ncbi:MAG: hypothetical protein IT160_06840 [Bryobacterales bacterium]|nr:hypothetical protein [Bryobacterales bacterium]